MSDTAAARRPEPDPERARAAPRSASATRDGAEGVALSASARNAMLRHALDAFPEECCGVLVGADGPRRAVARAVPAENRRTAERARRYLIDPVALRDVERAADAEGLQVIGFYHSHPDHPARPSGFDREHAWPWYSYLIVPVTSAGARAPRAWRLRDDRSGFDEQEIL